MAYPANRGVGGKFGRRPFARTPSKPYACPPTALHGMRGGRQVAGEREGWMSKLLQDASRLISNGASKLFATVFQRRLSISPRESGISNKDLHPGADSFQHTTVDSLPETKNKEMHVGSNSEGYRQNCSGFGVVELEKVLEQKTFSMAESKPIEKVLLSRTVESSDKIHGLASNSVPGRSILHQQLPSNGITSQTQTQMPMIAPRWVAPRSVIPYRYSNHACLTAKPVGRSAMYRMCRSPCFNVARAAGSQLRYIKW